MRAQPRTQATPGSLDYHGVKSQALLSHIGSSCRWPFPRVQATVLVAPPEAGVSALHHSTPCSLGTLILFLLLNYVKGKIRSGPTLLNNSFLFLKILMMSKKI